MEPIVLVGLFLVVPTIVIGAAFLVHQDAKRLGMDDYDRWFGIVVLTGGTGLLLYLLERDDHEAEQTVPADAEFPLPGATVGEEGSESNE
ncbi:hypothetical protein [Natronosalvus halobius]|uniref:hypothetical protein n=1 Tax=Natronosalvus halobius TaxID=2953746 RepID=UPI00209FD8CF|nr:hypothetical protein [Natronosalvus halobius]USZ72652.1 hypothetical protein NGM15_04875 [Natronosalvus halobius]